MFRTDGNQSGPTVQLLNAMLKALERGVQVGIVFEIDKESDITTQYNSHNNLSKNHAINNRRTT